jgi:chemotaxis protein methyltransferase CheR
MARYFDRTDDGWRINDRIRQMVTIGSHNLLDAHRAGVFGRMDLIFCRNVIIYFDLDAKRRVIDSFHSALHEGGYLLLGHSESLMNVTTNFALRHFRHDMIYQKPARRAGEALS